METEHRYVDEAGIPEYCTNSYNRSSNRKKMVPNSMDILVLGEFGYMVDCDRNFSIWHEEEGERGPTSNQLESSQSTESTLPTGKEEEDRWIETSIQEMFPDLVYLNMCHDMLHGVETKFPEEQELREEELHDVKPVLTEPFEELHDVKPVLTEPFEKLHESTVGTIFAESQIKKEKTVEGESEYKKLDDHPLSTEIKIEITETKITETGNNLIDQPTTSHKTNEFSKKKNNKLKQPIKKKKTKQEDQKENVAFIPNKTQGKGIEAVDLPSLLEKFEAIEKSIEKSTNKPNINDIPAQNQIKSIRRSQSAIKQSQDSAPKRSLGHNSKRVTQDVSQKKPAEMTKIPESKKAIPTISAKPSTEQSKNHNNNTHQMQNDEHTLSPNYVNRGSSIDLEHDYCIVYTDKRSVSNKHASNPHSSKNLVQSGKCNSLKGKSGIVSKVSDMNKPTVSALSNKQTRNVNDSVTQINSVLARNILKSRQKVPVIEIQTGQKAQQMISVLKKPPNPPPNSTKQYSLPNNTKETIITTTNSFNIKNIARQNAENMPLRDIKQPVRKINIEEYRKKRKQISNSNEINFSVQRKVVYIYHASTMTEPFKEDDKKVWSTREIDTVVKSVSQTETEKPKPKYCDVSVQTYETIFEFPGSSLAQSKTDHIAEETNKSGSIRSRSNTKSRSRSRTRNKSSSSSSRSRSRSNTRRTSRSRKGMYKRRRIESNGNRSKSRNRNSSTSRSRSRSNSSSSSRSRSRSRSRSISSSRRRHIIYNRLRRRSRDSSSSISSCTSNSRSRKCSRSSSHHSKSSSKYYSRRSRSPSISNHRRSRRWSSDRERYYNRNRKYSRRESRQDRDLRSKSPSQYYRRPYNDRNRREWQRQVEERRVVYVGGIEDGTTKADLRRRFEKFGRIVEISLHFRTQALSFGFVTFEYKDDAYKAVEHGNDSQPVKYHLSFGGRRAFCQVNYADLDGAVSGSYGSNTSSPTDKSSFDDLLQQALNRQKFV